MADELIIAADCGERPYGGHSRPVAQKELHLYGSVAPTTGLWPEWADPVSGPQFMRFCEPTPQGLFQITTTAIEYRRVLTEGEDLQPLPDRAISEIPAGVGPFTRRTVMQLEILASDGVDTRLFQMDANQSICIVAQEICVRWMGPPNTRDVMGLLGTERVLPRNGLVIDAFVGCAVSRIEVPPGDNSTVICTKHLFVPATEQGIAIIPPYAKSVTIYQEPTQGVASVMWTQLVGDPATASLSMGALPFIAGQRKTQPGIELGNVTHLQSDIDPDNGRFFTLVYAVRP